MAPLMSDEKKYTRTIRLTTDVNDRLIALCEHLGTNPNSYLVNEIGKAISRDELAFKAQKNTNAMMDSFLPMMELMNRASLQDEDNDK